ncbi:cell division protein FtsQ [Mucilaginibacter limnophilus]|uniref:Cell division protein FtsQ n=1 Tax=Mucilaginibacter limnophilus TaxID=1932778 RepID=A0A3S2WX69_9SPHI|nr:cell division protein FtsQ [Mucilaginibacter limnophilus]RVU00082.1 cell division protein FtsQ [Mucilaginibacter limnophilus]
MSRRNVWSRIFIAFAWVVCLGGLVTLMGFIEVKKNETTCTGVKVYIPGDQYFIDQEEVENILQVSSNTLVGRKLANINIHQLENTLKANPFVESAKVYTEMDGLIKIEISQRQPILRVINRFDQDFYVDQHGLKMPLSNNFTARVVAANGYIDELFANRVDTLHTKMAIALYTAADYIRKDSLWNAQVAQIYVNKDHEIELIPRVGNQRILLGNADSLDVKFENLAAFYKQALPKAGWDKYKAISVKYTNQVIGIKDENDPSNTTTKTTVKADSMKQAVAATIDSTISSTITDLLKQDTSHIKQH